MSFQTRTEIKSTRQDKQCVWCYEQIPAGKPSVTHQGKYDGEFYYGRYHPECDEAVARWWKVYGRYDDFPGYQMNRGGIEEKGEQEKNQEEPVK